jgi:hypothetical protein
LVIQQPDRAFERRGTQVHVSLRRGQILVSTVVGTGSPGSAGDGAAATSAQVWYPLAVALDPSGNLYIGDLLSFRVRKVGAATGNITIVASTLLLSGTNYTTYLETQRWGQSEDIPVTGDYDGDGRADLALYRPATGQWFVLLSSTGFNCGRSCVSITRQWGTSGDIPVPTRQ